MKDIVDSFLEQLKDRFGNRILGIYLFGSTAKGTATAESDIEYRFSRIVVRCCLF